MPDPTIDDPVLQDLEEEGFIVVEDRGWGVRLVNGSGPVSEPVREPTARIGPLTKIVVDGQRGYPDDA